LRYRHLLTDQTRVLRPDHRNTLTTRNNVGYVLGEADQAEEASTQFRALVTTDGPGDCPITPTPSSA
jgi:hypothetical protein